MTPKEAIKKLIDEVLDEKSKISGFGFNEPGTVTENNEDGTVEVQTSSGVFTCGTPKIRSVGEQVVVIQADGFRVAL